MCKLFGKLFVATGLILVHNNKLYPTMIYPVVLLGLIKI